MPAYTTTDELTLLLGSGVDLDRVGWAVDTSNALVEDWVQTADGTPVTVDPVTATAARELAHQLYRAQVAVGGVAQLDEILTHLPADRVRAIRDLLDARAARWGIA